MKRNWFKNQFKLKLPSTYAGFPVAEVDASRAAASRGSEDTSQQHVANVDESPSTAANVSGKRGIALLLAVMIVAVMMVFAADMIISSQVNLSLTYKQQENIKAEYLAKSGANLALFTLMIDYGMDLYMAKNMQQPQVDGVGDIWNLINGLPIGGDTAELMKGFGEKMGLNAVNDSSVIDRLKDFEGSFVINISDEMQKININDCSEGFCTQVTAMLKALFSCPAEKVYLETKSLNALKLTANIKDWVDLDKNVTQGAAGGDEDAPYEKKKPPYKAKNAPFFSLDELKMVDGWDPELHNIFADYLTIYPFKKSKDDKQDKININTASKAMLACLIPESGVDCGDKFTLEFKKRQEDKISMSSADEIKNFLTEFMCHRPENKQPGDAQTQPDIADPANWFDTKSTTFRIEVQGIVGEQTKTMRMVIMRKPPEKDNKVKYEDTASAYRLLYWKMF